MWLTEYSSMDHLDTSVRYDAPDLPTELQLKSGS